MVLALRWHGAVAHVELSRPERMNALNGELIAALVETGTMLAARRDCRAVVLSGAGRGFCSGIDLDALRSASAGGKRSIDIETSVAGGANVAQQAVLQWHDLAVPVIAAVHGVAFGGGLQLALGADLRIVAPDARLAFMEVKWGLVPDMAGMVLLPGLLRPDLLADLVFTGRVFDGEEAVRLGLATRTAADPVAAALEQAAAITALSPDAVRAAKRLMRSGGGREATLRAEAVEQAALFGAPNQREAVAAAMAGRAPIFVN
ncbi:crotonase/enoyl-CoA hydratase family protein [uncultured Sphingomonas sp.]|uniref:crotonase/enoyl-CoA hydratase family protein n=1 Tax=uncultured Sphingomonas sp. TaxID=158754 RepID=UPI0035CA878C